MTEFIPHWEIETLITPSTLSVWSSSVLRCFVQIGSRLGRNLEVQASQKKKKKSLCKNLSKNENLKPVTHKPLGYGTPITTVHIPALFRTRILVAIGKQY